MKLRERQRKKPDFNLSTACTLCGHAMHPSELIRTGWDLALCTKCGKEFALERIPVGKRTRIPRLSDSHRADSQRPDPQRSDG